MHLQLKWHLLAGYNVIVSHKIIQTYLVKFPDTSILWV